MLLITKIFAPYTQNAFCRTSLHPIKLFTWNVSTYAGAERVFSSMKCRGVPSPVITAGSIAHFRNAPGEAEPREPREEFSSARTHVEKLRLHAWEIPSGRASSFRINKAMKEMMLVCRSGCFGRRTLNSTDVKVLVKEFGVCGVAVRK